MKFTVEELNWHERIRNLVMFSSGLLTNLELGQDTLFLVVVSQSTTNKCI